MELIIFLSKIYSGLFALKEAVKSNLSLLWLILPVLILWVATEIYYGEYNRERFGFSSVFTGAISLLWLSFATMQKIFQNSNRQEEIVFWLTLIFALYALLIFYISFRHGLNEKAISIIASPRVLYFFSLLLAFFGIGGMKADIFAVFGIFILFVLLSFFFTLIKKYWLAGFLGELEAVRKAGDKNDL